MSNPYPQQQFAPQAYPPPQPSSGGGWGFGLLIGCLGAVILSVLLCAGAVWWVKSNFTRLIATVAREAIVASINESELAAQEKAEVIAQIDRVVKAFTSGKLNNQEVEKLFEDLQDSPIFVLIQIYGVEKMYLEPSGLSGEEKQAAKRVVERVFRGINEKKITHEQFESAMPDSFHAEAEAEDPAARPKQVSDEDVRTFVANLKKLADDAEIPDEPFQVDISDELKKDIDKALAGKE